MFAIEVELTSICGDVEFSAPSAYNDYTVRHERVYSLLYTTPFARPRSIEKTGANETPAGDFPHSS